MIDPAGQCAIEAVIERVVVTSGGVIMACWNVVKGGEPSTIRSKLGAALPRSPTTQIVSDPYILHTTLARVLRPPRRHTKHNGDGDGDARVDAAAATAAAKEVAAELTEALCGVTATIPAAWFVSERHKLALALGGAYTSSTALFAQC